METVEMKKNIFALIVVSFLFLGCAEKGTVNESPAPVPPATSATPAPDASGTPAMSPTPGATATDDGHDHSGDDHEGHDH